MLTMKSIYRKNRIAEWANEALIEQLFRRLETKPNLPQSKRVMHILELLARLGSNKGDWLAFHQIREPLKKYKWHYGLTLGSSGLRPWLFTEKMASANEWEYNAVRFLLSLIPHDINRLRRCEYDGCQRWFFAEKTRKQKFCKRGACRQNHYDSDPERRAQKRKKMRELRQLHKRKSLR
jgi:hypothetical protein